MMSSENREPGTFKEMESMRGLVKRRTSGTALRVAVLSGVLALLSIGYALGQVPSQASKAELSPSAAGQQIFATRCASCHGTTATGGEFAPSIVERVPLRSDDDLTRLLHDG